MGVQGGKEEVDLPNFCSFWIFKQEPQTIASDKLETKFESTATKYNNKIKEGTSGRKVFGEKNTKIKKPPKEFLVSNTLTISVSFYHQLAKLSTMSTRDFRSGSLSRMSFVTFVDQSLTTPIKK